MQKTLAIILLPLLLSCSRILLAEEAVPRLEWELGAALAALRIPLYPGSASSRDYLLPLPYARLRSEFLDLDEGIHARLLRSRDLRLSLSADLGVPVDSDASSARKGMPDLDTVVQIGPVLEMTLAGDRHKVWDLRFELPARLALATDVKTVVNLGWLYEPRISYEVRRVSNRGLAWRFTAGLRYASEEYHTYYYAVPAAFASAERAQFTAGSGYGGGFADVFVGWRDASMLYWAFARYQNISAAVFAESPLVEQKDYYFLGVGLTWIFAQSL